MAQSAISGGNWSISNPASASGGFHTTALTTGGNYTINLHLNEGDTGSLVIYISFNDNSNGQNYTVTSAVQTINVPSGTLRIQGAIQKVTAGVSHFYYQVLSNS